MYSILRSLTSQYNNSIRGMGRWFTMTTRTGMKLLFLYADSDNEWNLGLLRMACQDSLWQYQCGKWGWAMFPHCSTNISSISNGLQSSESATSLWIGGCNHIPAQRYYTWCLECNVVLEGARKDCYRRSLNGLTIITLLFLHPIQRTHSGYRTKLIFLTVIP